jgi:hypothetical protein
LVTTHHNPDSPTTSCVKSGIAASVTGDIANGLPYNPEPPFVSLTRTHRHTTRVTASSSGEIWLLVGTDSGFEGLTQLFYQRIDVTLVPVGPSPVPLIPPPTLLTEDKTGLVIALNAVRLTREPLSWFTRPNYSDSEQTRVSLFATGIDLLPGEDASAVSSGLRIHNNDLCKSRWNSLGRYRTSICLHRSCQVTVSDYWRGNKNSYRPPQCIQ